MKAYCNYEVMCQLINDKHIPIPTHEQCPYPKITPVSGRIIFHGWNDVQKVVYIPATCVKLEDGRGLFHGSFKLLLWAEEYAVANGLTLAHEMIPSPPPPTKKVKVPKAEKPKKASKSEAVTPKHTPRPEKPALSLAEIMAAKRAKKA